MNPTILINDGSYFNFLEPERGQFSIVAIAHSLSNICRFTGHVHTFYSVAQHSVLVSRLVEPEFAIAGLLHDAVEAFVGDVSAPLKKLLPEYKKIEQSIEAQVLKHFNLPAELPHEVKIADLCALITERRDLMPASSDYWACESLPGVRAAPEKIIPLPPCDAKRLFIQRFIELSFRL